MLSFERSPAVRMGVRTMVVAVLSYVATSLATGFGDWRSFALGAGAAGMNALIGVLTPVEPFVGIKSTAQVPMPPAEPDAGYAATEGDVEGHAASRGATVVVKPEVEKRGESPFSQ